MSIKLYYGDCISGIKKYLLDKTIDVVVTSPPYNIGVSYSRYKDTLPRNEYLKFLSNVGVVIKNALSDDGSFFINVGSKPSDPWIPFDVANVLREYFTLQNVIVWVKSIAIPKSDVGSYPTITSDIAVGHFKPLVTDRFVNDCFEFIFHFTKRGNVKLDKLSIGVPYQDKTNIGRWKSATQDQEIVVTLGSFHTRLFGISNRDRIHPLFQLNFQKCVSNCMELPDAKSYWIHS